MEAGATVMDKRLFILLLGLALFHFYYMDLWVLTARLLRLADKYS